MTHILIFRDIGSAFSRNHKYFSKSGPIFFKMVSLRVVQSPFILFSKSISERGGSDIERRWIQIIDRRCTSDPTLSDIDFKNKVAWV